MTGPEPQEWMFKIFSKKLIQAILSHIASLKRWSAENTGEKLMDGHNKFYNFSLSKFLENYIEKYSDQTQTINGICIEFNPQSVIDDNIKRRLVRQNPLTSREFELE